MGENVYMQVNFKGITCGQAASTTAPFGRLNFQNTTGRGFPSTRQFS